MGTLVDLDLFPFLSGFAVEIRQALSVAAAVTPCPARSLRQRVGAGGRERREMFSSPCAN